MKVEKHSTILVPLESWIFLLDKSHFERCGEHCTEHQIAKRKRDFEIIAFQGYCRIEDKCLGGCNGNPENAWEEHRWTDWSVADMKKILDEAGLQWKAGGEKEYIV